MTDDLTPIINRLSPRDDGEPAVKYRKGIVAGVGSGVIDVLLSGVVVPDVAIHGTASVTDEVHLLVWRGDLLAIGECGGGGGGCGSCNLGDLLNVDTSGQAQGDMLYYNGSNWVLVGGTKAVGNVPTIQGSGAVAWQAPGGGGGGGGGLPGLLVVDGGSSAYTLPGMTILSKSTGTVATSIRYAPIYVGEALTLVNLVAEVTGGTAAGREVQIGLYEADSHYQPGDLVIDGPIDAASTGIKTVPAGFSLPAGRYLLAWVSSNAAIALRHFLCQTAMGLRLGDASSQGNLNTTGTSFGAMPDPGVPWTATSAGDIWGQRVAMCLECS